MGRHYIYSKVDIFRAIKELKFCTRRQILLKLQGSPKRSKAVEFWLPELEETEEAEVTWYQGLKVYSIARRKKASVSVEHEVGVTECRLRFEIGRGEGTYVPERRFRGMAIVPDGGFSYPNGKMLVWEYTTQKNFLAGGVVKSKLTRYRKYLPEINRKFSCETVVLFVVVDERRRVKDFVLKHRPIGEDFLWTDYQTFRSVALGQQLSAEIYFWEDGNVYPLTDHD